MRWINRINTAIVLVWVTAPLHSAAIAQDAAPADLATVDSRTGPQREIEEVIVRGRRMSEIEFDLSRYIIEFLGDVVALPPGGGYARWHDTVCIGVHNLEPTAAQYIIDRISMLADEVGLEPGEPGCTPDVMIIFGTDANELAAELVENRPALFRPYGPTCCMQLGLDALERFVSTDRPVRWWHLSMPVDTRQGQRAIQLPTDSPGQYPILNVAGPSRIHNGVEDRLVRIIIIADGRQLAGTTWEELGDYLALVSLAQINPQTDPSGFDSILNLFSNPAAYSGLTDWDRSYIRALYEINTARRPELQRNQIVNRMAEREREEGE
jgi:hypothetical protein